MNNQRAPPATHFLPGTLSCTNKTRSGSPTEDDDPLKCKLCEETAIPRSGMTASARPYTPRQSATRFGCGRNSRKPVRLQHRAHFVAILMMSSATFAPPIFKAQANMKTMQQVFHQQKRQSEQPEREQPPEDSPVPCFILNLLQNRAQRL